MPDGINQRPGTAEEVREAFKGWDPKIDRLLEFVSEVLEWRVRLRIFPPPLLN
jgi:salicylate hydroxylase